MDTRRQTIFAVIGASGNVGLATSSALRSAGAPVRAILRNDSKAPQLKNIGCEVAIADLQRVPSLAQALDGADAVQVIIPLSPQAADPAEDLRVSVASVIAALSQVCPKRILAISDYGAHIDYDIGMPSMFHDFEARLRELTGEKIILRSAEHMHNLGRAIPSTLTSGILSSFQPSLDMLQPMIAAQDLGLASAKLLLRPATGEEVKVVHAEGPRRYSANDVAAALTQLSGRTIRAQSVPRSEWEKAFETLPASLAGLLIKANEAKNQGGLVDVEPKSGVVVKGVTDLVDALRPLVSQFLKRF
jgi:NAD(P)H dehydrogenase (quinone)